MTSQPITRETFFIKRLEMQIESCTKEIERFKQRCTEDPLNALSWSDNTFKAVAERNVFENALMRYNPQRGMTIEVIGEWALGYMMRMSASPNHSSSNATRMIYEYELSAWSQLFEMCKEQ